MIELTEDNFKETQKGKVVIDFYASWCGKCKMIKPKLEEIAEKSEYKIYSADVDKLPAITNKFGIMNLPTLIVFEDGCEIKRGNFEVLRYLED